MKFFLLTAAFIFAFAFTVFSQTPTVSPTPVDNDDVVKISTALIQIDATVTDKNGKVITDLKPEEVEIYENGKRQEVTNFSFISNVRALEEAPKKTKEKTVAAPLAPGTLRPEQIRRTMALVVDDLTLSFESVYYVRRALKKFVDEQMQDGDMVAIIRTGAGIGALQQFTTDRRQLYAAIEKVRWNPAGAGGIGAFAPIEATALERAKAMGAQISDEQLAAEKASLQGANDFRGDVFATGTLGAINYIVRGMEELPGRKSIMLMSDGFKLYTKDEGGFMDSTRVLRSLQSLIDLANRASVVVYTMDARGLQTLGATAADDTSSLSSEQIEGRLSDRRNELFDTQDGLRYLARQTGGTSIINNNDLNSGIRKMLDDQSYYLIGYQPDEETFDPKTRRFNKLDIKVKRDGARVRYRSGFFGVNDEETEKPAANLTAAQQIKNALTSPFAVNDISLRLNALFGSDAKQGAFVRSFLHVGAKDLTFSSEPSGDKKVVFDLLAVGFGDNGVPAEQISKTYTLTIKKENFQNFQKNGFVYDFTFPIKKAGAYQFRVALLDKATGKVGSANQFVEVPNLKKERLTTSGIVLENIAYEELMRRNNGQNVSENKPLSDYLMATSLRQFKRGTVLTYVTEIYNAKLDAARNVSGTFYPRLFRDGKLIFEGKPQPIPSADPNGTAKISVSGALNLGTEMQFGEYVLQIVVNDNLQKEKRRTTTQFVQFEVIE